MSQATNICEECSGLITAHNVRNCPLQACPYRPHQKGYKIEEFDPHEDVAEKLAEIAPRLKELFEPLGIALFIFDPSETKQQISFITNCQEEYVAEVLIEWAIIKGIPDTPILNGDDT